MDNKLSKTFILEGLDCTVCAAEIEEEINKLDGISNASLNFATKMLSIELTGHDNLDDVLKSAETIIKKHEPRVNVKEKVISKPEKKVLLLIGLGCANCAAKIEKEINNIKGIKSASVDFVLKKLTIEISDKRDIQKIIDQSKKIIQQIESGIKVVEAEEERHVEKKSSRVPKMQIILFILSCVFFGVALLFNPPFWFRLAMFFTSYLLAGYRIILIAGRNILKGKVFDENFLMTIATIGAFVIQEFPEAAAVMLFYNIGEFFQQIAVNRSRRSIGALMDIRPDYANLKIGGEIKKVSPEKIGIGDIIIVKPGEKAPLDGKVIDGKSMLDTSALTGESVPRDVDAGSEILSGSVNLNGLLTIEVTREYAESTVSKILDLVQNASSKKAPTENFITKFSKFYTPIVVFTALLLAVVPPLFIQGATFSDWINRALVFLVVSCPCALVVSIPLGFFGGIGCASRNGILVKGSNYLEALNNVDTIVFDKTGTLTKGVFQVTKVVSVSENSEDKLLEYAAYAESYSNHPIALSILKAYGRDVHKSQIENYTEISGHGIVVRIYGKEILAGNGKLMVKENIAFNKAEEAGSVVYLAIDGQYAGYIVISDEIKADSQRAIQGLKKLGIRKLVMLTGDNKSVATKIGAHLGIGEIHAELLPDQKVQALELLEKQKVNKGKLLFVGDGINDAPVLARADVGVAMGGVGSDAAIEAADVVLMTDEPSKLISAIRIAKRTRSIVWQNIFFALDIKAIVLLLGAGGLATMWEAVFADVGVTLVAVMNAMRVWKFK